MILISLKFKENLTLIFSSNFSSYSWTTVFFRNNLNKFPYRLLILYFLMLLCDFKIKTVILICSWNFTCLHTFNDKLLVLYVLVFEKEHVDVWKTTWLGSWDCLTSYILMSVLVDVNKKSHLFSVCLYFSTLIVDLRKLCFKENCIIKVNMAIRSTHSHVNLKPKANMIERAR